MVCIGYCSRITNLRFMLNIGCRGNPLYVANEIALSSYSYKESLCELKYEKYSGLMSQEESPEVPS